MQVRNFYELLGEIICTKKNYTKGFGANVFAVMPYIELKYNKDGMFHSMVVMEHSMVVMKHSIVVMQHSIVVMKHSIVVMQHSMVVMQHSMVVMKHSMVVL
jgi:hypothetical protein